MISLQEAISKGEDFDRVKVLDIGADEVEKWERRKKKKNPDTGFAGEFHLNKWHSK